MDGFLTIGSWGAVGRTNPMAASPGYVEFLSSFQTYLLKQYTSGINYLYR